MMLPAGAIGVRSGSGNRSLSGASVARMSEAISGAALASVPECRCAHPGYRLAYPPNSRPRLHAFSATADPRMKTICSSVRVEKNVRMWVM